MSVPPEDLCICSLVDMESYDLGSGPEFACASCEWCWGAEGQSLKLLDAQAIMADIEARKNERTQ